MIHLTYTVRIAAPPERVWDDMLGDETYREWTKAFSPGSHYVGDWSEGSSMDFVDPGRGGTRARIEESSPPSVLRAVHVAVLGPEGAEDTESESARKWIGSTETYRLCEVEGGTELLVEVETDADYVSMFDQCWPKALEALRAICER